MCVCQCVCVSICVSVFVFCLFHCLWVCVCQCVGESVYPWMLFWDSISFSWCEGDIYVSNDSCAKCGLRRQRCYFYSSVSSRKSFPSQHATLASFAAVYVSVSYPSQPHHSPPPLAISKPLRIGWRTWQMTPASLYVAYSINHCTWVLRIQSSVF